MSTLEMTFTKELRDSLPPWGVNQKPWLDLSLRWAKEAEGPVVAIIRRGGRQGGVWRDIEFRALMDNPKVPKIMIIDPITKRTKVIYKK